MRAYPERLPQIEPSPGHTACRITEGGRLRWKGKRYYIGRAWDHEIVGVAEGVTNGEMDVYFGPYLIAKLDLRARSVERLRIVPVGRCAPSLHDPQTLS